MIAGAVRLVARPEKREEVLRRVKEEMFAPTRRTPGCIKYRFYQDVENPNAFSFVEEWESWRALHRHFTSEHVGRFLQAVGQLVSEPPEARFYEVVSTSTLEEAMQKAQQARAG